MISDRKCDQLCKNIRGWFVEEELNADGELIYAPPPLDEVWLEELKEKLS